MDAQLSAAATAIAEEIARELGEQGAIAVVLAGSFARGDATVESDLDLYAIGDGPHYRLERRGQFLVSTSWRSVADEQQAFRDPARAGGAVPGWRSARILYDPDSIAAGLQAEARNWTWDVIGDVACNRFVADEITGLAEEVHKLATLKATARNTAAAVQRSILAFRLGVVMATHLRLAYDSENVLWDQVSERLGSEWRSAQTAALGLGDEPFDATCRAALKLYGMVAREAWQVFDSREREVVVHACRLAGYPVED